jgi:hypothetical protein
MPSAQELAKSLAVKFLENGNYEALGLPLGHDAASLYAQAAFVRELDVYFEEENGFSGLAVHSVGYTAGADVEKVLIYVTRGSRKALNEVAVEIEGVPVEARLMGKMRAGPVPSYSAYGIGNFFEKNGRLACGSSCAPSSQNYAGTLGAFVRDGAGMLALSNNHVFAACNHTPVGMPILAPATMDARPGRRAPAEFCRHEQLVELRSGDPALVPLMRIDAAIGRVTDANLVSSWQGDATNGFDTPAQAGALSAGVMVKKFGRTTGLTLGTIEAYVPTPWILPYKSGKFSATVWFMDTWTIRSNDSDPFALPGDSGSLVVTEDARAAVGLLFAVNNRGQYGIIAPIDEVLVAFGQLQLVSGHGI